MTTPAKVNKIQNPPYKVAAVVLVVALAVIIALVYVQFRGGFTPEYRLTMVANRAGLVMDPGAPVTYNGVQIGRVASISEVQREGKPAAQFALDVKPRYIKLIPQNVEANIAATTVFGNKYVSLTAPENNPSPTRISSKDLIVSKSVTTEFNTLFQTIMQISEKVDPVKLNLTLSAAADALTGLGDKFGASLVNANNILDNVNPRMDQARHDVRQLSALADVYADASPDLWDALTNAVTAARTLHEHEADLDAALLSAAGFGNTGEDIFNRGGPYLVRGTADLVPTSELLDTYSPEYFCMLRNFHDVAPKVFAAFGGDNHYSLKTETGLLSGAGLLLNPMIIPLIASMAGPLFGLVGGAQNPYVYPDNLGRVNAHGGPAGAPGCWQPITRDLWPAPTLVVDDGASIAPYNHLEIGSPWAIEYVWGRQVGENTINP
ncbi:MCE family protein [Mycobacterium sp. pUA109]|uniref:MCE family protein n=1 Tax=Mycobacterium sp. pUA109 TaxID=3238982 RepID=UPI00351B6A7A